VVSGPVRRCGPDERLVSYWLHGDGLLGKAVEQLSPAVRLVPVEPKGEGRLSAMDNWIVSYKKEWLRPDLIAGLPTAAVVIPKAMAYATIAGLPVQVGLYTAFLPMVIYAVLGTSRVLSVSTTTTLAILVAARLEGRVFFVNAENIAEKIKLLIDEAQPRVVALHLRGVPDLEYTALKMMIEG
jgi:MFS superfamily sulfate permease-like transporter